MKYYLMIILAAFIFGSSGIIIKKLLLPVSSITFFRIAVPFLILTIFFLIKKKRLPKIFNLKMIVASLLNSLRMFFFFAAYTFSDITTTVILLYTWPVFTALWSVLLLKEKLGIRKISLFMISIIGVVIVFHDKFSSFSDQSLKGIISVIISAFVYSLTIIIFKKESKNYDQWETVWFQNLTGTFIFLPFLFLNSPPSGIQIYGASFYGILIGIIGFGLFFKALQKVDASIAAFLTYFEIVSAIFFGVFFLGESLTLNTIIGGLLIISSALMISRVKN